MSRLLLIAFSTAELPTADGFAGELGLPYDLALLKPADKVQTNAERVFAASQSPNLAAEQATALISIAKDYSHFASPSSMAAKDLLPRIAALAGGAMITDVTEVMSPCIFKRAMFAGSVIATVEAMVLPVLLTFLPGRFARVATDRQMETEPLVISKTGRAQILEERVSPESRRSLTQAKVVVSGGRPLRDAETFERVIGGFADAFGGAVGATRAAVDAGIAPNDCQVGQTGKVVAPSLYLAAGISGSTQHVAGIKDSRLIVAVNKDPNAPIFSVSDLGIVGDLFDVLPQLEQALKKEGLEKPS